jgi:hypothetical protein
VILVVVRDVAGHGERPAARLLDLAGRLSIAVGCEVGGDDARTLARKREGASVTDAAGRSGDERDLAVDVAVLVG